MKYNDIDPYGEENWDDDIIISSENILSSKINDIISRYIVSEIHSPNTMTTRERIVGKIDSDIKNDIYFNDIEYKIKCNEENNSNYIIDNNLIVIDIYLRRYREIKTYVFSAQARINNVIPPFNI